MATVSNVQVVPRQQSVWQKLALGAAMGTGVGLAIGLIGGCVQVIRAGPGPNGALRTIAGFMGTSAATFGFFLSIGTVIRTEGIDSDAEHERLYARHREVVALTSRPSTSSSIIARLQRMPNAVRYD